MKLLKDSLRNVSSYSQKKIVIQWSILMGVTWCV